MIRSAVTTLTLWYLALIMVLSIGFSVVLYHISKGELNRGLRRQGAYINIDRLPDRFATVQQFRADQLAEEEARLRQNLLLLNVTTLIAGGAASYFLARRTLQPIEESFERQSRFTADASHELRTPLTAMQTEIEVALRDPSLSKPQAKQLLASNLEEIAKLRSLSDGLLRLAQQDGKDIPMEAVQLKEIIEEALNRVRKVVIAKKITIEKLITDLAVKGDKESLVELVTILLDNAIKYSPDGSKVLIEVARHAKVAHISVRDQGIGIKASDLVHIFDRFYRADASRSKQQIEGYGLGLSIARQLADLHNGIIEAKSVPGKGSTFTAKLPIT